MPGDPQFEYSSLYLNLVLQAQPLYLFLVNIFHSKQLEEPH